LGEGHAINSLLGLRLRLGGTLWVGVVVGYVISSSVGLGSRLRGRLRG